MTLRVALTPDQVAAQRRDGDAVTVARAAEILGCDETTVRALLRRGGLEGHRIGKTDDQPNGVRVELQSVVDYKRRHAIAADQAPIDAAPRPRRRPTTAAHREAVAYLRSMGSRI